MRRSQPDRRCLLLQARGQRGQPCGRGAKAAVHRRLRAIVEVVDPLFPPVQRVAKPRQHCVRGEPGIARPRLHQAEADRARQPGRQSLDAVLDAMLRRRDQLRCRRRRRRPEVSDKVRNREVGLVPNGGDDRQIAGGNGSGEKLVVECGEIFNGAAATGDQDQVGAFRVGVEPPDPGDHRLRAGVALHDGGIDEQVQAGVPPPHHGDDVTDHRPSRRSNDTDAVWKRRQRTLARRIEQALVRKPPLQLLKGELQRPGPARLHGLGNQLQLPPALIDRNASAHQDSQPILWAEAQQLGLSAKQNDGELRFAILQREVHVAGSRGAAVRDLALDPDVRVRRFRAEADVGNKGADREDTAFRRSHKGRFNARRRRNHRALVGSRCLGLRGRKQVGLNRPLGAGFAAQAGKRVGFLGKRGRVISSGHSL